MIKERTFKGGTHPLGRMHHGKHLSEKQPITKAKPPAVAVLPMAQHIGAPAKCVVKVGDTVKMGQLIGEPGGFVSAPVHASISGKVIAVEPRLVASGAKPLCVVIENDFQDTVVDGLKPAGSIEALSPDEIKAAITAAGMVGMGGAAFPTHVKLSVPPEKNVDCIILNGAECEPFLTADHRVMLEKSEDVVLGLQAIMKAVGVQKGYIGVELNKPDAIAALEKAIAGKAGIEIVTLKVKYPQGAEKQLINAATGREVPSGALPADAGVVVSNVGTAAKIAEALSTGMPLIERVVTVSGAVKSPANLLVRIGTPFGDIIEQAGGTEGEIGKILNGGPMMGQPVYDTSVPVLKGTSGIVVLSKELANTDEESNCIRCGRCAEHCPIRLQPLYIDGYSRLNNLEKAEAFHALDCIECGVCSYVCPAKRQLVQSIRLAKGAILAARRKKA
ncbi:MAG: electron transport complex subunit RsxC [Bacillota bacterium]